MRHLSLCLLTLGSLAGATVEAPKPAPDAFAPALKPKLLCVTRAGGPNDQWLPAVRIKGTTVQAGGPQGFSVVVTVDEKDDSVSSRIDGQRDADHDPQTNLPNSGKGFGVSWGYNQVDPLLQQPYLRGSGWELWGWDLKQAKGAKARYAPYMADSRIRTVTQSSAGYLFVVGTCDGGNTCFQAHPADINRNYDLTIGNGQTGGGGGGQSSFCWAISPKGKVLNGLVCRGMVTDAAWDEWDRTYIVGRGVIRADHKGPFDYPDGGGLMIADAGWTRVLMAQHFNAVEKGDCVLWGVAVDSRSGLAAVSGYINNAKLNSVNPAQAEPGGGKDGFLAVFRLWTRADYDAAKQAEKDAKTAARAAASAATPPAAPAP